jgi:hypothetical protein
VNEHGQFVLVFDPQDDDSGMLTGRVRLYVRKVQVQRDEIRSSDRLAAATVSSLAPERLSSETVCASKPALLRISAASAGRFSSILNLTP